MCGPNYSLTHSIGIFIDYCRRGTTVNKTLYDLQREFKPDFITYRQSLSQTLYDIQTKFKPDFI